MVVGTKLSWPPAAGSAPALAVTLSTRALPSRVAKIAFWVRTRSELFTSGLPLVLGNKKPTPCCRRFHHSLTGSQVTSYRTRVIAPDRLRLSCCSIRFPARLLSRCIGVIGSKAGRVEGTLVCKRPGQPGHSYLHGL